MKNLFGVTFLEFGPPRGGGAFRCAVALSSVEWAERLGAISARPRGIFKDLQLLQKFVHLRGQRNGDHYPKVLALLSVQFNVEFWQPLFTVAP